MFFSTLFIFGVMIYERSNYYSKEKCLSDIESCKVKVESYYEKEEEKQDCGYHGICH